MEKTQITWITNKLNIDQDSANRMGYTAFVNNYYMIVADSSNLYSDINRWRYKFDDTNELIERVQVQLYSKQKTSDASEVKIPNHNYYDIYTIDGYVCVYEYFFDSSDNNRIITDYFSYKSLNMFVPRAIQLKSTDIVGA